MKQQLENSLYDARSIKRDLKVYQIGDLESLSATVLYTGHLPPMGPGGVGVLPNKKGSGLFDSYNSTMSKIKEASAKISSGEIKVEVPKVKRIEQVSLFPNNDALKVYTDWKENKLKIRYQPNGVMHKDQKKPFDIDKLY